MANNLGYTPGTGATVATTESAGVHTQHALLSALVAGVPTPLAAVAQVPSPSDVAIPVRPIGQDTISASFAGVGSSLLSPFMTQMSLRTMTVAQSAGNLVVSATTTANAEFLARSNTPVMGAWQAKYQSILSQRIANNNFAVILGDLIGVGLTVTWTATVLTINKVAHGFTATNVGQAMFVSFPTVTSGVALPGRYVIASIVNADSYTMTVAGFTTGGGTATLFGRTHVKVLYNGTTATAAAFDSQREGWASGDTTLTTLTSASPGHMVLLNNDARQLTVADMLVASGTAMNSTMRGFRVVGLPADDTPLYLFLWAYNGSTNPASGTTWTMGFWSVEDFSATPVHLAGNRLQGGAAPMPTTQVGTVTVAGSLTSAGTTTNTPTTPTASAVNSAATTNATSVKASAGTVYAIGASNIGAAVAFVKLYNKASAPTVGTDVPVLTLPIPAGAVLAFDMGALGYRFSTGIALAITNLAADADATAVAAAQVKVLTSYI